MCPHMAQHLPVTYSHLHRLLYGPPAPYTRERFQDTYRWMQGYPNLVAPGATYEEVVDNRAWQ